MTRFLVDLNIVLDVLLQRAPHVEASAALWAAIETGSAEGALAAHCVTTLHYLACKDRGLQFANRCVSDVLSVFAVAPVDVAVLRAALASGASDFEDAVCAAAAASFGCHAIVTRDPAGFRGAPVPSLTPIEALALLSSQP